MSRHNLSNACTTPRPYTNRRRRLALVVASPTTTRRVPRATRRPCHRSNQLPYDRLYPLASTNSSSTSPRAFFPPRWYRAAYAFTKTRRSAIVHLIVRALSALSLNSSPLHVGSYVRQRSPFA